MRALRGVLALVVALAGFALGFAFVALNDVPVTLDLLWPGWQWSISSGVLVLTVLVLGLLLGLLAGLGLRGLRRPRGGQS
jgi:putative membrane protein